MSEFEPFRQKGGISARGSVENPCVAITHQGIHLGTIVHRELLDSADHVELLTSDDDRVGIRPLDEGEHASHAYSSKGATVRAASLWHAMGVDVESKQYVDVDTESAEFPVIDVSPFTAGESSSEEKPIEDSEPEGSTSTEPTPPEPTTEPASSDGNLDELRSVDNVGAQTINNLQNHGDFSSLQEVREASVSELANVPGLGKETASRMSDHVVDVLEGETPSESTPSTNGSEDGILDVERVETALDSVGMDVNVSAADFIQAIDEHSQTYDVAKEFDGAARGDIADLVNRLDLKDALESDDRLAAQRFEGGTA